jgi:predicted ATPase
MRGKRISLLGERISRRDECPFNVPAIASLETIDIASRVCFFVGENGAAKSTRMQAIAARHGCRLAAGNPNFLPHTTGSGSSIERFTQGWRFSFPKKTGGGVCRRAVSFFKAASHVDAVDASDS